MEYVTRASPDDKFDPDNIAFNVKLSEIYKGEQDTVPSMLNRLFFSSEPSEVFAIPNAYRAPVSDIGPDLFGFFKYDAFRTGRASLFVANLDPYNSNTADLTRRGSLYGNTYSTFGFDSSSLSIRGHSMEVVVSTHGIGTWYEETKVNNKKHLNCYPGHGLSNSAWFSDDYQEGENTVAGCMLFCISEQQCQSITVQWLDLNNNQVNPSKVKCFLHSSVTDVNSCSNEAIE